MKGKLEDPGERAKEIQEAEKRLTEIKKKANKEQRRVYEAQQVVIEALKNLEALNWEARALSKKFPEVRFVYYDISQPIKNFRILTLCLPHGQNSDEEANKRNCFYDFPLASSDACPPCLRYDAHEAASNLLTEDSFSPDGFHDKLGSTPISQQLPFNYAVDFLLQLSYSLL